MNLTSPARGSLESPGSVKRFSLMVLYDNILHTFINLIKSNIKLFDIINDNII